MLENISQKQWQRMLNNTPPSAPQTIANEDVPNPLIATSLRRFHTNTILRYGFQIFNAKLDSAKKPNLSAKIRLLRDGNVVLDGKLQAVETDGQNDFERIAYVGGFGLGDNLLTGDYILQISVVDNLANEKRNVTTQFVQFEIVK